MSVEIQEEAKWYNVPSTEYDEESESEDEEDMTDAIPRREETPVPEVSDEFREKVLTLKHSLYDNTVLAPELGTTTAQSNKPLDDYVNKINKIYRLSLGAQKGLVAKEATLNEFPAATRDHIQWVLRWIADFFPKNSVVKTIPYEDFLRTSFHVYPFNQN